MKHIDSRHSVRRGVGGALAALILATAGAFVLIAAPPAGAGSNPVSTSAPALHQVR